MKKALLVLFMIAVLTAALCLTVHADGDKTIISEVVLTGSEVPTYGHHAEKIPLTAPEGAAYAEDIDRSEGWQYYLKLYGYDRWQYGADGKWENWGSISSIFPGEFRYSAALRITEEGYEFAEDLKVTVDGIEWTAGAPDELGRVRICSPAYTVEMPELPFTDCDPDAWYNYGVSFVYVNGIMDGTSDATFSPDDTTSRGMIVTMLYALEGKPEVTGKNVFSDVENGSWYEKAIVWAYENGIAAGVGSGIFSPDADITREQLAAILYKFAAYKGYDTSLVYTDKSISSFIDVDLISPWAHDAILWCMQNGMINGVGLMSGYDMKLMPKDPATRAQTATIITRFIGGKNFSAAK